MKLWVTIRRVRNKEWENNSETVYQHKVAAHIVAFVIFVISKEVGASYVGHVKLNINFKKEK